MIPETFLVLSAVIILFSFCGIWLIFMISTDGGNDDFFTPYQWKKIKSFKRWLLRKK